jgi:hypothetical protein
MIWNRNFHALIPRNPIIGRELRRQRQTTSTLRGFIETVGAVAIALGLSVIMLFSFGVVQDSSRSVKFTYRN